MRLNDVVRCVACAWREEEGNGIVMKLLNRFSRHGVVLLPNLVNYRLLNQGCAPSFRSIYRSVSISAFETGVHTPSLTDYVEERNFVRESPELRNHVQFVFPCDKFGSSRRLQNSFVMTASIGEEMSVP